MPRSTPASELDITTMLPIMGGSDEADAPLADPIETPNLDGPSPLPADDPLVTLGLVDPRTGKALPTEDWNPQGTATESDSGSSTSPGPTGTLDWDSPDNPYKAQVEAATNPVAQARGYLQSKMGEIESRAQATYATLVARGMDDNTAQAMVKLAADALQKDARNEAEHIALGPQVRRHVAEDIAKKHSTGGIKIDPNELVHLNGPEAMEEIARQKASERRTQKATQRSATGTDRVESGAPAGSRIDYSKLSPQQAIAIGLRREAS